MMSCELEDMHAMNALRCGSQRSGLGVNGYASACNDCTYSRATPTSSSSDRAAATAEGPVFDTCDILFESLSAERRARICAAYSASTCCTSSRSRALRGRASPARGARPIARAAIDPISPFDTRRLNVVASHSGASSMRVFVDGVPVYFPYEYMYPEQYAYMCELKRALDARGHCVLEMPTGTGKTVTLLSFICSYQLIRPEVSKLIYCTRTVGEMDKVLHELERVLQYRNDALQRENSAAGSSALVSDHGVNRKLLAVGLTTRRNLCLHESVVSAESREEADSICRSMTASWVRAQHASESAPAASHAPGSGSAMEIDTQASEAPENPALCKYYENFEAKGRETIMPSGVYTMDRLMAFGREHQWCPYFTARHAINVANVVVYNYQYLLDPKVAGLISKDLARESVVVFDEAHNIDNVCIEALSVNIKQDTLNRCLGNLSTLTNKIRETRETNAGRLQEEYERLVASFSAQNLLPASVAQNQLTDALLASPVLPHDLPEQESVPGSLRKAEHFVMYLRRIVDHLRRKMQAQSVTQESARLFTHQVAGSLLTDVKTLRCCSERLKSLLFTLEVTDMAEYSPLNCVADFATLLGAYGNTRSFGVIFEPYDERLPSIPDPILQLACLDSTLAMQPVFERFQTVVLTSGTLSPLDMYSRILGFQPVVSRSFTMSLARKCIAPMIVSRGSDQQPISSKYELRNDAAVIRNYGSLVIELAAVVPDGMVVFFVSYIYMEMVIQAWSETGVLQRIAELKLVFIETPDTIEASLALDNFRRAVDQGRGAVFFSVARGKVAEGIDFDQHYGRCVVMIGVPFQYTESRTLRARLEYMREVNHIRENDYLSFDAMRQASQCVGRVIRSKADYGIMVLADKRYVRADKKNKLPPWILGCMEDKLLDLDTEMCVTGAKQFLKEMAQPLSQQAQIGTALLTEAAIAAGAHMNGTAARGAMLSAPAANMSMGLL
ncbi:DNA repair helicase XPD [Porphyridium purpureum]|uniref:DNA 5'-3' helicase n=1 Tax=Porphyridium purpureum TaxID=35688 RepID=A0A5J4YIS5_PORPP|nr:DNA repair helicase XPD [Porphyridium purpureum]|eukprot:POR2304..scf210_14